MLYVSFIVRDYTFNVTIPLRKTPIQCTGLVWLKGGKSNMYFKYRSTISSIVVTHVISIDPGSMILIFLESRNYHTYDEREWHPCTIEGGEDYELPTQVRLGTRMFPGGWPRLDVTSDSFRNLSLCFRCGCWLPVDYVVMSMCEYLRRLYYGPSHTYLFHTDMPTHTHTPHIITL